MLSESICVNIVVLLGTGSQVFEGWGLAPGFVGPVISLLGVKKHWALCRPGWSWTVLESSALVWFLLLFRLSLEVCKKVTFGNLVPPTGPGVGVWRLGGTLVC